jgi:FkbM family methyltransferase
LARMAANSDRTARLLEDLAANSNQAAANNERLVVNSKLLVANSEKNSEVLSRFAENGAKTSEAMSRLGEQLLATAKQLDRIFEHLENQATASNLRLDYVREELKASSDLNKAKLEAIETESRAANVRLDRLVAAARAQGRTLDQIDASRKTRATDTKPSNVGSTNARKADPLTRSPSATNDLLVYQKVLDQISPWAGEVPKGYLVDFLGTFTDAKFRTQSDLNAAGLGGAYATTEIPQLDGCNGEWWFETVDWLAAAQEASGRFVMITLGACYGAQAVGAFRALQMINPMPCKLVAVEPEPQNFQWLRQHLSDNGIDPTEHWLVNMAISEDNNPVFFPVGAAGSGANNCVATNDARERRLFLNEAIARGKAEEMLRDIVLENSVSTSTVTLPGEEQPAKLKLVSAVTVKDLIDPFDLVDYLEADIQQSEIVVFPAFINDLREKVRRIHIGTHGAHNHHMLRSLFKDNGWNIVFDYGPDGKYESPLGEFETCDGVLTMRNPNL